MADPITATKGPNGSVDKNVRSVESLQRLYSSAAALAVATAVSRIVIVQATSSEVTINTVSLLWAAPFFATLLPFYHGALRHLDDTYIATTDLPDPPVLLFDFLLLFLEAALLIWLAFSLSDPAAFERAYVLVLFADVAWAVLILVADRTAFARIHYWLYINVGTILVIGVVHYTSALDRAKPVYLVYLAILRTVLDYRLNWNMFFPKLTASNALGQTHQRQ
jgi:hypothetical protein